MTKKSGKHFHTTYGTLNSCFNLIASYDLYHWRSNQQPQIAELKLYHWAIGPYHTEAMPN